MTTNDTPLYRKEIVYDHEARDYACYLDGELVAYERTYHEAEVTLDQLVFDLIGGNYFREPDGPSSPYPPQDVDGTPDPDPAPGRTVEAK